MKAILLALTVLTSIQGLAFTHGDEIENKHEGKFYFYWGWNRSAYSTSDMQFSGEGYQFDLGNVKAKDRQSPLAFNTYLNPKWMTIPQYNFRIGYFICDNYELSFGVDHMKYVMVQDQKVFMNGKITGTGTAYDGDFVSDEIALTKDFLILEHSDGLNYINASFKRFDDLLKCNFLMISVSEGFEIGGMMPKTNATLMNKERHDDFHWAGYGASALGAVTLTFWKHFFIQSEAKLGFVSLPDVRTTPDVSDSMSHNFSYFQGSLVFGYTGNLLTKKKGAEKANL